MLKIGAKSQRKGGGERWIKGELFDFTCGFAWKNLKQKRNLIAEKEEKYS